MYVHTVVWPRVRLYYDYDWKHFLAPTVLCMFGAHLGRLSVSSVWHWGSAPCRFTNPTLISGGGYGGHNGSWVGVLFWAKQFINFQQKSLLYSKLSWKVLRGDNLEKSQRTYPVTQIWKKLSCRRNACSGISCGIITCKGDNQASIQWLSQLYSWTPTNEWASHFKSCGPRGLKP